MLTTSTSRATRLRVQSTVRTAPCHLDPEADLAVAYAEAWHRRAGGLRIPTSALIRRALSLYARGLSGCGKGEFHAAKAASAGSPMTPSETQLGHLRIHAGGPDEPLPHFEEVLHGFGHRRAVAELHARLDATLEALPA